MNNNKNRSNNFSKYLAFTLGLGLLLSGALLFHARRAHDSESQSKVDFQQAIGVYESRVEATASLLESDSPYVELESSSNQ